MQEYLKTCFVKTMILFQKEIGESSWFGFH